MSSAPKIAIVHDWFNFYGGAERTVRVLHDAFPDAPIYVSTAEKACLDEFKGATVRTTWLQKLPKMLRRLHTFFPVLRVWAFRSLDLSEFDVVIISSSAESKQVTKRPGQTFICYCHTPIRYYWSHYEEYKKDPGFGKLNWIIRAAMPLLVPPLRRADYQAAQRIDQFVANSETVKARIKKYYKKDALVVHPPIDTSYYAKAALTKQRSGFVTLGRQVPYKRTDLAVTACTKLSLPLAVYGNGSQHKLLRQIAGSTISFFPNSSDAAVAVALGGAKAFLFPSEEDFGMVQVGALAAGTPVIAYKKGGATEIIEDGKNGVFFEQQTIESLVSAIKRFEKLSFTPSTLHRNSKRFDKSLFITKMRKIVRDAAT